MIGSMGLEETAAQERLFQAISNTKDSFMPIYSCASVVDIDPLFPIAEVSVNGKKSSTVRRTPKHNMIRSGDLLSSQCDVIVQQCNCVTVKAHGLSAEIKKAYPFADIYGMRSSRSLNTAKTYDTPGVCKIMASETAEGAEKPPLVACLLGQFYPGKAGNYWRRVYGCDTDDSPDNRLRWFKDSLLDLSTQIEEKHQHVETIGFPFRIGCGLAGGDWRVYETEVRSFASKNPTKSVYIYKLE